MAEEYGSENKGLDRILALSDGIFAFSLTLLALSLVVPQITTAQANTALVQKLANEIPSFIVFVWSFIIVGLYWIGHHRVFRFIKSYDSVLIWCNLISLMFITLVPFITNLDIQYGNLQITVVISAIFYSVPGLAIISLWRHASKNHRLIDKELTHSSIRATQYRNLIPPMVFLLSIPFSFINPYVTEIMWIMMIPLRQIVERLIRSEPQKGG